jgi:hypothetical protein
VPTREQVRELPGGGPDYEGAGRKLSIPAGQAYMIATGVPADGSNTIPDQEMAQRGDLLPAASTWPASPQDDQWRASDSSPRQRSTSPPRTSYMPGSSTQPAVGMRRSWWMTRTRFCDSRGLRALLCASERVVAEGGELRLVLRGDGSVPRIVILMCLDRLIPGCASLEEALARCLLPQISSRRQDRARR